MKAVVQNNFNGIESLSMENIPSPKLTMTADLIQVKYAPVLPWDIKMENGTLSQIDSSVPRIIGYSFSGIIKDTGILRNKKIIGKKVIGVSRNGTFANYISSNIPFFTFVLPDNVSLEQGATVFGGADTALMTINELNIMPSDKILIIGGSGGIGTYLIQMLNIMMVNTVVYSSKESEMFLKENFDNTIITNTKNFNENDFDYIIDTSGSEKIINQVEPFLKVNGTIFPLSLPNYLPNRRDINVIFKNSPISPKNYKEILNMISHKSLIPYIDSAYNFNETKKAQLHLRNHGKKGRTLVNISK